MNIRRILATGCLAASCAILTGCMALSAGVAPSTSPLEAGKYTEIGPASGSAWGAYAMFVSVSEPDITKKARDRAIASSGGDALVKVTADNKIYNLMFVTLYQTTVNGVAVKKTQ